jgi:hypothetical protein
MDKHIPASYPVSVGEQLDGRRIFKPPQYLSHLSACGLGNSVIHISSSNIDERGTSKYGDDVLGGPIRKVIEDALNRILVFHNSAQHSSGHKRTVG